MGNNLSTFVVPDTSAVVLSDIDRANDIKMVIFWIVGIYGCAMVFSTCALIDRWKGPYDKVRTGGGSVLVALLLSTAWPLVLAYLMVSS